MAFIGRERELAVLGSALQRAGGGEPTRVAIAGPLGVGISHLLDELEARLSGARELVVCRARCYEPLSGVPYGAIATALGEILGKLSDERLKVVVGNAALDIGRLIPDLSARLVELGAVSEPTLSAPDQRGARVRESLLGTLVRLAGTGQLCLIVEDLEHSDPGTRLVVQDLLRISRRLPLTIIVGYHPDNMPRGHPAQALVHEIDESRDIEHLALESMSRDELFELVEKLEGDRPTLGFMAAVMEGSGGNPLIAGQLVEAQRRLAGLRLSDPLDEIIQARLLQLDRQQGRLLRLLAIAHRPVSRANVASVRLNDGHLPAAAAERCIESGLAVESDQGLSIVHELCSEAITQSTLPAERHELHAALADQIVSEPAEAAWHWMRALKPEQARTAHLEAAGRSEPIEPGPTTLMHYSAALELGPDQPEVDLLEAAARAADATGSFRRAATLTEQAIERLAGGRVERLLPSSSGRRDADRERAAQLIEQLGRQRRSSGDLVGAREAFEQAVSIVPAGAHATQARVLAALAQDLMLEGNFEDSALRAEEARQAARNAGDNGLAELAHATDTLAVDLGYTGEIDRGLELLDEAAADARSVGRLDEIMRCYANRTTLLDLDSRREQALAAVKDGMAEANRNGLGLTYGAFLRGNAADILFQLGRWEEAEAECRVALEFAPAGVAWFSPILYLGLVLVESRADDEAARLVGQTLLQLETVPAGQWSALVLRTAVSLALWRGDLADAMSAAEQGWARVSETNDPSQIASSAATVLEACAAAAERGRLRRDWSAVAAAGALAGEVLPVATEHLKRIQLPPTVGTRREAELYLATARAHNDRVRGKATPEAWAELATAWAKIPVPYQVAKARWWQAQAALPTRARRAEARRALTEAWKVAAGLPARPLQRALRELAERGRITLPAKGVVVIQIESDRELVAVGPGQVNGSAPSLASLVGGDQPAPGVSRFGLSPRENAVLLVLAQGRTNREIAERLFISERTVAVHVRRILSKLGVSGRVEAAGLAIRLGLVPDDPRVPTGAVGRRP